MQKKNEKKRSVGLGVNTRARELANQHALSKASINLDRSSHQREFKMKRFANVESRLNLNESFARSKQPQGKSQVVLPPIMNVRNGLVDPQRVESISKSKD